MIDKGMHVTRKLDKPSTKSEVAPISRLVAHSATTTMALPSSPGANFPFFQE